MDKRYGLIFDMKKAISRQIIKAFFTAVNVANLGLRKNLKFTILRLQHCPIARLGMTAFRPFGDKWNRTQRK